MERVHATHASTFINNALIDSSESNDDDESLDQEKCSVKAGFQDTLLTSLNFIEDNEHELEKKN